MLLRECLTEERVTVKPARAGLRLQANRLPAKAVNLKAREKCKL